MDCQYIIYDALTGHEEKHRDDFIQVANETFNNFSNEFLDYQPTCEEASTFSEAIQKGKEHYNKILADYQKKLVKAWQERIDYDGDPCTLSDLEREYEQETQKSVHYIITDYRNKLIELFKGKIDFRNTDYCKESKWTSCNNCN